MFTYCVFREVPKIVCEGMGAAAFRHGLREMLRPEHRAVIFDPGGKTSPLLVNLALDILAIGTPVLLITNQDTRLPDHPTSSLVVRTPLQVESWAPILDVVPGQLMSMMLAQRKGFEPGKLLICSNVTAVE
jgi:glucosamine 6-phosphate synthetase-like amidotransferase/phosphosugar isomerase protein